jgi:hypothetical protein
VTRDELRAAVASHRYGIHAMEEEHFGMGPAEILSAGCLLFAHDSGGPVEILGGEERLLLGGVRVGGTKVLSRRFAKVDAPTRTFAGFSPVPFDFRLFLFLFRNERAIRPCRWHEDHAPGGGRLAGCESNDDDLSAIFLSTAPPDSRWRGSATRTPSSTSATGSAPPS